MTLVATHLSYLCSISKHLVSLQHRHVLPKALSFHPPPVGYATGKGNCIKISLLICVN